MLDGERNGKTTTTSTKLTIEWKREREATVMIWYAVYDGHTFNRPSEHIAFESIEYTIYRN